MAICTVCKLEKGTDFRRTRKVCRKCENAQARENTKKLKDKPKPEFIICKKCGEKKTEFRINRKTCLDCERKAGREYRQTTDKAKVWVAENKERMSELQHNWYAEHKTEIRQERSERLAIEPEFKYAMSHRIALSNILSGRQKSSKYVNCSGTRLRNWFQFQFTEEMTWENYGDYWTVDHVIPVDKFLKEEQPEEIVFHWLNVSPVPKQKNLTKNKHVTLEECQEHTEKVKLYLKIRKLEDPSGYLQGIEGFCDNFAKHLVTGTSRETSGTTSPPKGSEGSRLTAEPDGNKSEVEKIRRRKPKPDNS